MMIYLDEGIGVTDGATIMGSHIRDALVTDSDCADTAKLVLGLLSSDSVDSKAALDIKQETEVLASLFDADDIHETSRV